MRLIVFWEEDFEVEGDPGVGIESKVEIGLREDVVDGFETC